MKKQQQQTETIASTNTTSSHHRDGGNHGRPTIQNGRRRQRSYLNDLFIVVFGIGFVLSLSLNIVHSIGDGTDYTDIEGHNHHTNLLKEFKQSGRMSRRSQLKIEQTQKQQSDGSIGRGNNHHLLNCEPYGGPSEELAKEMIYWKDIPSDANYQSPFLKTKTESGNHQQSQGQHQDELFLTFEPDGGGWNNIRMAMESTIGLAIAMGRTLVMPPQKKMYLLQNNDKNQRKHFSFVDFFPIMEIAQEHPGFKVITTERYLVEQGMTGKLKNKKTGQVEFPPGNRTNWDGSEPKEYDLLKAYLRNVTITPMSWNPDKCLAVFPDADSNSSNNNTTEEKKMKELFQIANTENKNKQNTNHLLYDVTSTNPLPRLKDTINGRTQMCLYDETLQKEPTLHFQCNGKLGLRMLIHFYAFLFFENWVEDLWLKRFIRDHVRYVDEIQCAAARVVVAIRNRGRERKKIRGVISNDDGDDANFDTMHIRRGDFQFKDTRVSAEEILETTKEYLKPNTTIYVATDEKDKSFFDPFKQHGYDVYFLDDFLGLLQDVNTNYYGMIDQLISTRGDQFWGCWFSTFTGYIMRLRGYHSTNSKLTGYQHGVLPTSYYYTKREKKIAMHHYTPIQNAFYSREFPTAWRDIDKGITEVSSFQ